MDINDLKAHIGQRYGLTDLVEIGRGGMGVVYKAWDPALKRHVAVKQLSASALTAESQDTGGRNAALHRFNVEMQTVAKIRHSAIVSIHYSGITDGGSAYFVMDFVPGNTLSDELRKRKDWNNPFTIQQTVELLRPIAAALDYLHLKLTPAIVHRDVKPGNILVPSEGSSFEARSLLTDFGISLTPDETRITTLEMMIGTEAYTAPELYPGRSHGAEGQIHNQPTASSDNYALSLIAFEMLTLHPLKDTMSPAQWQHDRPLPRIKELGVAREDAGAVDELTAVFTKALGEAPAYRYPTASAFIDALAWAAGSAASGSGANEWQPRGYSSLNAGADVPTRDGESRQASGPHTAPPTQRIVPQDYPPQPGYASQPMPPQYARRPAPKRGKVGPIVVAALATVLVLVLVAGAALWALVLRPIWSTEDAVIADAFPNVVSSRENGSGWKDLTCSSRTPSDGQLARITCANSAVSVVLADYGDGENRDSHIPLGEHETLSVEECQIASAEVAGNERSTYLMNPVDNNDRFAILLSSDNAKSDRLSLPLC